jgi:hypothetical protein
MLDDNSLLFKEKKGKNSFGGNGDKRKCLETNSRNPFTEVNDFRRASHAEHLLH